MLRALLYGLGILHLGPGIAFALLAFGCEGARPALGAICSAGIVKSFVLLSVFGWLVLGLGLAAVLFVARARRAASPSPALRAQALLAVLAAGGALGAAGAWLTGGELWLLAVPVALAAGWLALANPLACERAG